MTRFKQVRRTALVAAIAIACMFSIMVTAQATGVDVFGAMVRWTEDIFSFGQIAPDSQVSDNPTQETKGQEAEAPAEFASLQEAFDAYGMTEVHEPTWLPEGYTLDRINVLAEEDPFLRSFSASYTDGEGRMGIDIMSYEGEPNTLVQKTDAQPEVITQYGINFYLIENISSHIVAWYDGEYEYYASGDVGEDVLWKVAISMFEEEFS